MTAVTFDRVPRQPEDGDPRCLTACPGPSSRWRRARPRAPTRRAMRRPAKPHRGSSPIRRATTSSAGATRRPSAMAWCSTSSTPTAYPTCTACGSSTPPITTPTRWSTWRCISSPIATGSPRWRPTARRTPASRWSTSRSGLFGRAAGRTPRFTDARQDARPICPSDVRHQPDWGNFWAPVEHSAVVFEGDRYDPQHKIVSDVTWTTPWFNLACAGSVPAKMLLMRRTNAASFGRDGVRWYTLSTRERQAMLKMFTADYCGTGQAFTVDGQPLIWWESHHWYDETPLLGLPAPRPVASVEALWDENGALCLTTPRMAVPWTGPPTTVDEVRQACPAKNLRDCPTDLTGWETYAKVLTLNPVR